MKTIREATAGKFTFRMVEKGKLFVGIVIFGGQLKAQIEGTDSDDVWRRLHDEAGKIGPNYFGYVGAGARFLHWFNGGFQSSNYLKSEREYKVAAKTKLDVNVPLERALIGVGFGPAVWSVFQTNLLSHFEKMRVRDLLHGPSADDFIRSAARFTTGGGVNALAGMEKALRSHDCAKWTIATYLPFLWRPQEHMFLKPEATKDFAERVGHRFALEYDPRLNICVYDALLDLVSITALSLQKLEPRDRIDIQSLIWVVGDYKEDREQPCV